MKLTKAQKGLVSFMSHFEKPHLEVHYGKGGRRCVALRLVAGWVSILLDRRRFRYCTVMALVRRGALYRVAQDDGYVKYRLDREKAQ